MLFNKYILITNDDGVYSQGLIELVKELCKYADATKIMIVAPDVENSAVSQKITLHSGLKLVQIDPLYNNIITYSLSGTPSDCVKIALDYLKFKPDLVVSGMNKGYNLGNDILYSGTLGACFEACLSRVQSFGISSGIDNTYSICHLGKILEYIYSTSLKDEMILNINIPLGISDDKEVEIKQTVQGHNPFENYYELRDGLLYLVGEPLGDKMEQDPNSDILAITNKVISITPLTTNRTKF